MGQGTKNTSWNKLATWYDSLVGKEGHRYHKEYAIPTVIKLLELNKGDRVLEVGCGQGALSAHIHKAGAKYVGVDYSTEMVNNALKYHRMEGSFFTAEATKLSTIPQLAAKKFDCVVFMLSIQDMNPLGKIIEEASKLLETNGRLVIFMLHPAFRIPRQSGWGEDKTRKLVYRRVDRYATADTIPLNTNVRDGNKKITSFFYHRPLQAYFHEITKNGLMVNRFLEIEETGKGHYSEFPMFLGLRAIKVPTN